MATNATGLTSERLDTGVTEEKNVKRYYLSKIFQDTAGTYGITDAWHHRLQTYTGIDYVGGNIKVDPATGVPTEKALLVLVGGIDHSKLQNDPDLVPMPVVPLDIKVSSIQTDTKLTAKSAITKLGFDEAAVTDVWGNADGLRDIINHYGRLNNAEFDANNFDVDES